MRTVTELCESINELLDSDSIPENQLDNVLNIVQELLDNDATAKDMAVENDLIQQLDTLMGGIENANNTGNGV
jgi:hypothetical protein